MGDEFLKVGLFGGSFNPPHVCHTLATLWALQTGGLDQVWWMPTYQHAFGKNLVSFEDRVRMCQMATSDLRRVEICEIERELGGESRTIDTVQALTARNPNHRYTLIIGTDILAERHKWKNWDGLMELVDLLVIGRTGHLEHDDLPDATQFALPQVSSTAIRAALAAGGDSQLLSDWMVQGVLEFVRQRGFYKNA